MIQQPARWSHTWLVTSVMKQNFCLPCWIGPKMEHRLSTFWNDCCSYPPLLYRVYHTPSHIHTHPHVQRYLCARLPRVAGILATPLVSPNLKHDPPSSNYNLQPNHQSTIRLSFYPVTATDLVYYDRSLILRTTFLICERRRAKRKLHTCKKPESLLQQTTMTCISSWQRMVLSFWQRAIVVCDDDDDE